MFKVRYVNSTCSSAHSPNIPCIAGASAGPRARRASATLLGSSYNAIGLRIDRHKRTLDPDKGHTRSQHYTKHYHCIQTLLVRRILFFYARAVKGALSLDRTTHDCSEAKFVQSARKRDNVTERLRRPLFIGFYSKTTAKSSLFFTRSDFFI